MNTASRGDQLSGNGTVTRGPARAGRRQGRPRTPGLRPPAGAASRSRGVCRLPPRGPDASRLPSCPVVSLARFYFQSGRLFPFDVQDDLGRFTLRDLFPFHFTFDSA